MSWVRKHVAISDLGTRKHKKRGYGYKLCPYSTEYRERFKYEGQICTSIDANYNPVYQTGVYVIGNSTNPNFHLADYFSYECSGHTTTSGRMEYIGNPPGWVCRDPNCYYTTTVASGQCYREV